MWGFLDVFEFELRWASASPELTKGKFDWFVGTLAPIVHYLVIFRCYVLVERYVARKIYASPSWYVARR